MKTLIRHNYLGLLLTSRFDDRFGKISIYVEYELRDPLDLTLRSDIQIFSPTSKVIFYIDIINAILIFWHFLLNGQILNV